MQTPAETPANPRSASSHGLLRRFAQAGFWFFLLKGLLWLVVSAFAFLAGYQFDWF